MAAAGASGGAAPTLAFTGNDQEGTDATSFSFTFSFGAASATRYLVVAINAGNRSQSATTVTAGGVACSELVEINVTNDKSSSIWITDSPVTTNGTQTVTVDYGANQNRIGVGLYELDNINPTPTSTNSSTASPSALNLSVNAGDIVIAGCTRANATTIAWVGVDDAVYGYDASAGDTGGGYSGGADICDTTETRTISATGTPQRATSAVFGPA